MAEISISKPTSGGGPQSRVKAYNFFVECCLIEVKRVYEHYKKVGYYENFSPAQQRRFDECYESFSVRLRKLKRTSMDSV